MDYKYILMKQIKNITSLIVIIDKNVSIHNSFIKAEWMNS